MKSLIILLLLCIINLILIENVQAVEGTEYGCSRDEYVLDLKKRACCMMSVTFGKNGKINIKVYDDCLSKDKGVKFILSCGIGIKDYRSSSEFIQCLTKEKMLIISQDYLKKVEEMIRKWDNEKIILEQALIKLKR